MNVPRRSFWSIALSVLLLVGLCPGVAAAGRHNADAVRIVVQARSTPAPLGRDQAGLRMQVDAGFGGNYRPEAWVPVRVRIFNGGATFSGTLSIDDNGSQATSASPNNNATYTRTIVMPQGGTKDVTLYVPGIDLGPTISVLLTVGGQPRARSAATLNRLTGSGILVGVLSSAPATLTQLRGLAGTLAGVLATPVALTTRSLDSQPLALANLDAIVLSGFNSSELANDQRVALEEWVRAGGTLIVIGGPTAQAALTGLPTALRLINLTQPRALNGIPGLNTTGSASPAGTIIAASGKVLSGAVLLTTNGMQTAGSATTGASPLVVEQPLGLGSVVYSAIDPTLAPLAGWRGLPRFWTLLAGNVRNRAATMTATVAGSQQGGSQNSTLDGEIDNVSPPSITLFIVLLGLYVLLLVPLNFIILQRLRRRDWSWVSLPVLALILVVATFGSAYYGRGHNVRTSAVSVVFLTSGNEQVAMQSYVGLFSPLAGDYSIAPDDARTLGSALFSATQGSGNPVTNSSVGIAFSQDDGTARMPNMSMWSSRNVMLAGTVTYRGGLEGSLAPDGSGHLVGTLRNTSGAYLHSLVLAPYGGTMQALGDLAAGGTVHVNIASGATGPTQQSLGDLYGAMSAMVPVPQRTSGQDVATIDHGVLLATMHPDLATLLGSATRVADGTVIPTNPDESLGERFQRITQTLATANAPAALGAPVVFGWTNESIAGLRVNGDRPARQDTTLLVQTIPVTLRPGSFVINPGTLPARLTGSDQDVEQAFASGGFSISSNSTAVFVAHLPPVAGGYAQVQLQSLTLSVFGGGVGGGLSSQSAALYDWRSGAWVPVDVTNGTVNIGHPGRFVDAAGNVRVRLSAQDSSLGISDQNTGVTLGASGRVR